MKIFLAGGTGAIGKRLIPVLIKAGHQVVASTRSRDKSESLRAAGAQPVVADGLDRAAVKEAVTAVRPEIIVHQMTALANVRSLRKFDEERSSCIYRDYAEHRDKPEGQSHSSRAGAFS